MASSALNLVQSTMMDSNLFTINTQARSPLETPSGSLSKLDLQAPGKAKREYEKGYQLLMKKDLQAAVEHLTIATTVYANFVSAHNALGSAYLSLGQNDQARAAFAHAIALDDHLPTSYFNLGCAELALKHYPAAEEAIQKASTIAPLDLTLLTALAYGQYMNQNFWGVVKTAQQVHKRKHDGAAMIHFFAAAAWEAQQNYSEAQGELDTLLNEDPRSPAAGQAHQMMQEIKEEASRPAAAAPELKVSFSEVPSEVPSGPAHLPERIRKLMQESRESAQIAEAEAEACPNCGAPGSPTSSVPVAAPGIARQSRISREKYTGFTLRSSAEEVAVFFAATDHGKPVSNLTLKDVGIRDDSKLPAAVTGFRNQSELPLRLGLVIDTSDSVAARFKFEQECAARFLQKVVTGPDDLAFVVGFANSVLLIQDFSDDQRLISHAVSQLVPSGGTALWDAVAFAADKLATRPESQPVARILVVISDGDDNSSSATAKEAINHAQHGEVTTYTVSTRDITDTVVSSLVGEHALKTLADLTGGAALTPGSIHRLNGSLTDLQQVIRSRYLVSYKPALFKRNGQYRAIDITAEKDGHKLHVYARKGYFAAASAPPSDQF
ncbi:MAG TPA: VWA domain-containing protein [Candidatus Acidoferrum sp.]|nr:VWA domain-containing protein [Candidatus Acidoferrum sp.]